MNSVRERTNFICNMSHFMSYMLDELAIYHVDKYLIFACRMELNYRLWLYTYIIIAAHRKHVCINISSINKRCTAPKPHTQIQKLWKLNCPLYAIWHVRKNIAPFIRGRPRPIYILFSLYDYYYHNLRNFHVHMLRVWSAQQHSNTPRTPALAFACKYIGEARGPKAN